MSTVEIYALVDPRDGAVRYVGKANNAAKRLKGHIRDARRRKTPVYAWIRKLVGLGLEPALRVLDTVPAESWQDVERARIAEYRESGRLLNVAEGGDEPHCPLEVRRANGRLAASKRNDVVFYLINRFGRDARWLEGRGKPDKAAKQRAAQARLQALTTEQQDVFAAEWIRRGHYWPGRAHGAAD